MAKEDKKKDKKNEKEEKKIITSNELLAMNLKENKEHHYNEMKDRSIQISTGSLIFDINTGGGIKSGIVRMTGVTTGGKTSETLTMMLEHLKGGKKRKALYVKAEGKLPPEVMRRSGIKFVEKEEDWVEGTCFLYKTQIYEPVANLIEKLIKFNEEGIFYFFTIDSMDALIPKGDIEKTFDENGKVSGTAGITANLLRRVALPISVGGHFLFLISQVRAEVKVDKYAKKDFKPTNSSGGFALDHYPEWIFEFQHHVANDQQILDKKGVKKLGHWARVLFRKTTNETDGLLIQYPIRHNQIGGNSVWKEYEIVDILIAQEEVKKNGSWFALPEEMRAEVKAATGIELPAQVQGEEKLRDLLMDNPTVTDHFFNKIKSLMVV